MKRVKFILDEKEMPTTWYNILADLPELTVSIRICFSCFENGFLMILNLNGY